MDLFSSKIKKYLDRLADSPKKPNSFLFVGPEGTGKEEAAYYFISKLAGKDSDVEFRKKIENRIHPDVVVIEPETEEKKGRKREKEIGISQVKDARERLKFFPYELKKKFCLVKKANRLSGEASNALLKVLEEPSADAFFILLSPGLDSVLPTIQSRCAIFRFPQMSLPRWNEENRQKLRKIFAEEVYQRFEYVEEKSKDRNEIISILEDWEMLTGESIRKIMSEIRSNDSEKRIR
jgi:DNA polymerase-3 subunit delta'